jgi:hypothetical protein
MLIETKLFNRSWYKPQAQVSQQKMLPVDIPD